MNNKKLGSNFEQSIYRIMANHGYWVHFITPDARGAQPFDIIATRCNIPYAIECKTLTYSRRYFTVDRLEDNQILAFNRWMRCGNDSPIIAVKQANHIVTFKYVDLAESDKNRIDMIEARNSDYVVVDDDKEKLCLHGVLKDMLVGDITWKI